MGHGTHMNVSYHTYEWVTAHIWIVVSHTNDAYHIQTIHLILNESRHTDKWVTAYIWMSHATHVNESRKHTDLITTQGLPWVRVPTLNHVTHLGHIRMSHVTHMSHIYEWVTSHTWATSHTYDTRIVMSSRAYSNVPYEWVTWQIDASCHTWMSHITHIRYFSRPSMCQLCTSLCKR